MSDKLALRDITYIGETLAESNYFDDAKKSPQAIVKILAGQELGIGPVASMTGIHIVMGNITLSGNLMASLIKASQKYDYKIAEHSDDKCTIEFFHNNAVIGISEFTISDAKRAEILDKKGSLWKKYPKNMLFNRAISNGAKWFCPDLFNGQTVYTTEELDVLPEPEFIIETSPEGPPPNEIEILIRDMLAASPPDTIAMMKENRLKLGYEGQMNVADITLWLVEKRKNIEAPPEPPPPPNENEMFIKVMLAASPPDKITMMKENWFKLGYEGQMNVADITLWLQEQ